MPVDHTEKGFEAAIEAYLLADGYSKGNADNFDPELALDPVMLMAFIQDTQPDVWEKLSRIHGQDVQIKFLQRLHKELGQRGMLDCLRHGITDYGVHFKLAYFAPVSGLNPDIVALYEQNRLTVTRQVHFSPKYTGKSVDLLLSLNGLPIATAELKNPLTGQTVEHAKRQYREDRDPRELLFQFKKRAVVHFAVDTDNVFMTTRLAGASTFFLPFNLGRNLGAGNPDNPRGYKTAYLWEVIWQKDNLLDILARFLHLQVEYEEKNGKRVRKETMIFPRFHQWSCVKEVEADVRLHGAGQSYLIQHSAGSGKSNSIAWLAHRLASIHDEQDRPIFDSVIVITDRRVLDKQLQDTIYQFEHKQGVVAPIDADSKQLAEALNTGKKIIITTLQKFPFILDSVKQVQGKRFAVLIDEAHSSQTGTAAAKMRQALSLEEAAELEASEEAKQPDAEDEIARQLAALGQRDHLSFLAFTATPKKKTLEMFGRPGQDGLPQPFHLYSMRQAIEEGFILDVLQNYMTYATYIKLAKQIEEDPNYDKRKAARAIARFVSLHPHNLAQKTEIMVEHFRRVTQHKIGGRAKAMVVTSSRMHAVRYKEAFDAYLRERGYGDIKALVAFSGTVKDEHGQEYTEAGMNQFSEKELPERFNTDEYQVLLVAEKYQTGYDQPLLHTMFVDKKLAGIKAVQTLSRLNRRHTGKNDTFVLDFVNTADDIQAAFQPYYETTVIDESTDLNLVYDLRSKLDAPQVYFWSEVEGFSKIFFKPQAQQTAQDQGLMNAWLDPAVDRWWQMSEEEQDDFRTALVSFVRIYSFVLLIAPFQDPELHKLHAFCTFLLRKLRDPEPSGTLHLDGEVGLESYRIEKTSEGNIILDPGVQEPIGGPTSVGKGRAEEEREPLSEIIERLNQRFGNIDFTAEDQVKQFVESFDADDGLREKARANEVDNFQFAFADVFMGRAVDLLESNQAFYGRVIDDVEFRDELLKAMVKVVYERLRAG